MVILLFLSTGIYSAIIILTYTLVYYIPAIKVSPVKLSSLCLLNMLIESTESMLRAMVTENFDHSRIDLIF